MNDFTHLNDLLRVITQPIETLEQAAQRRNKAAREIIYGAYIDGMEFLEQDGYCCADLFKTWGQFSRFEVLTEGDSEAIFKSLDAAMRNCTEANLIALGKIVRDEAIRYIAEAHKDDVEYVQEEINERTRATY